MTPTIVKAADAAQFLSFVPRLLGFQPTRSLVVIPFGGTRSLGAMRFDLPPDDAEAVDRVASTVIGMVCRVAGADAIAAVVYTDLGFADEGMPHRDLLDALALRADACGLRLADLLCVARDAWGSALDPESPAGGRGLDELDREDADLAALPLPVGDQASGAALPEPEPGRRELVGRALHELRRALTQLCGPDTPEVDAAATADPPAPAHAPTDDLGPVPAPVSGIAAEAASPDADRVDPRALAAASRLDDLPELFEAVLRGDPEDLDAYDRAALVWCLERPSLRDIALVQWSGNLAQGDEALAAQLRWESGEEYPPHLAMRMWGDGEQPSPARLDAALKLVRTVAGCTPRDALPGPLAMCAWLAWALGRSTHAGEYAQRACDIDPDHGLAQIVLSFVRAGHLPDWAFRR
ncbi:DUF4192 family protein [Microbacterium sp. NEAU-LLC]|uniref:DUF4192 family protein n=1 Tax=Microbacterium helvum TaxID=2773713 RepID=A0ABR8NN51_9MICO|nr:DUF4192 family protein [Microbacterium helvum]MBD3941383.1 DUF4192 family protein [Microbacterium helvum]